MVWLLGAAASAAAQAQAAQASAQGAAQQRPYISDIEFRGNRRYARDMLLAHIFSHKGDPYDEDALRRDFHALWNTGYFEDIRLTVQPDPKNPNGRIVIFTVVERPVIRRIRYVGLKSVTESDVLQAFKDRKVGLSVESQFDPTRVTRAAVVIQQLLAEHGHQFATVRPTYARIPAANAVILTFNVDEGPKVKVGRIQATGNRAFSNYRIVRSMRHSRPYAIPLYWFEIPVMSKTFDRSKLDEDLEVGVRGLYQDHGYFRVLVQDPKLQTLDVHRWGLPGPWPLIGRKRGKRTDITVPIEEGARYRMGQLFVRSADPEKALFFKPEFLKGLFPLKQGDLFAANRIRKAFENYKNLYGQWGFIDFAIQPEFDPDEAHRQVNLTLEMDQGKQYYVRRIEFSGNTTTRDKVIRREILLNEGDLFNNRLWEMSLLRLNQLGYFENIKPENADIKRDVRDGTVDILLKVKEKGKQSIGLTGGISGIAGSFVGLSYQTNNFLGLGETLTFETDVGDRQRNFIFGFTEPYLLDRPISLGFTVFSSRFSYNQSRETSLLLGQRVQLPANEAQNYNLLQNGFTVFASYPLRRLGFTRLGLNYAWTTSDITAFSTASQVLFQTVEFRSLAGPSALKGIVSSKLTPTLTYSTVNDALNPTTGKSLFFGLGIQGGPLQGNVNALLPTLEAKYFHPVNRGRNVLAFRLLTAFATGFGGRVLPPFNRFYIGGEDTVRGFDFFTISPWAFVPTLETTPVSYFDPTVLGPNGQPTQRQLAVPVLHFVGTTPGGDSEVVANAEYRIPIVGPVSMSLFADAGLNGALRRSQLQLNPTALTTLRQDFPNADFPQVTVPAQLKLASATNFRWRTSVGVEFVVQLPIVNAPFRFYWAYNPNRVTNMIVEPPGAYFIDDKTKAALPPHVLESQLVPQLQRFLAGERAHFSPGIFEPAHTFRFTISRTF
jgi:outer membrane protein insertion porin family